MQESEIFRVARRLDGVALSDYLHDACGNNAALRADVEALLEVHHRQQGSTLMISSGVQETQIVPLQSLFAERYRLRELIGHGGMGLVYLADQQEPIQRQVAIKIIKSSHASQAILTRFDQERQALALMDHPHIAKVYDAGVTQLAPASPLTDIAPQETPYLVMEYLQGIPITRYCEMHHLDVRERVALFIPVCQAVQHAHQKGIIHRDMKPSNILVVEQDGKPVAKVIDFGIAKALELKLTELSVQTEAGAIVGTLEYMSPEQARLNNQDVDTRTDIYSLGVILYELVAGVLPFSREEFSQCGLNDALEMIQRKEPRKPSSRLSKLGNSSIQERSRITGWRKTQQQIQGDLDWIVMKCLEKDRQHRYESAGQLSQELERYLANEPVQAGPPSWTYKLSKLLRRNRLLATAAALVVTSMVAGTVAASVGLIHARKAEHQATQHADRVDEARRQEVFLRQQVEIERDRAEEEKKVAEAINNFLRNKLLAQSDYRVQANSLLELGMSLDLVEPDPRISVLLERAASELSPENIETHFPRQPAVQAALLQTVGGTYLSIGKHAQSIQLLERAEKLMVQTRGPNDLQTLILQSTLALGYLDACMLQSAIERFEQLRLQFQTLHPDKKHSLLAIQGSLAHAYEKLGQYEKARELYLNTVEARTQRDGQDDLWTQNCERGYANTLNHLHRFEEAKVILERLKQRQEELLGKDHAEYFATINALCVCYVESGRPQDAVPLLRDISNRQLLKIGKDHPRLMQTYSNLATALRQSGQYQEAVALFETVIAQREKLLGTKHLDTVTSRASLGAAFHSAGNYDKAEQLLLQAARDTQKQLGDNHPTLLLAWSNLGAVYLAKKDSKSALRYLEPAVKGNHKLFGKFHPRTQLSEQLLANCYTELARWREAMELLDGMHEQVVKQWGPENLKTIQVQFLQACCLQGQKKYQEAQQLFLNVVQERQKQLPRDHPETLRALGALGANHFWQKQWSKAIQIQEPLLRARERLDPQHPETWRARNNLASSYQELGRWNDALPLFQSVYKNRRERLGPDHADTLKSSLSCALALNGTGKPEQALPVLEDLLERRERLQGMDHEDTLVAVRVLARTCWLTKKFENASRLFQREMNTYAEKGSAYRARMLLAQANLGVNLKELGRFKEAATHLEHVYRAKLPTTAFATLPFLECLFQLKQTDSAQSLLAEWRSALLATPSENSNQTVSSLMSLATLLINCQANDKAVVVLDDVLQIYAEAKATQRQVLTPISLAIVHALKGKAFLGLKSLHEAEKQLTLAHTMLPFDQTIQSTQAFGHMVRNLDDLIQLYQLLEKPEKVDHWTRQRTAFVEKHAALHKPSK